MTTKAMTCTVRHDSHLHRLVVTGEIDLVTTPELHNALQAITRAHPKVILDLSGARFLSSAGISTLYKHWDHLAAVVVAPDSAIARALSTAGFAMLISAEPENGAEQHPAPQS